MNPNNSDEINFFSEISENQITAREFFTSILLDSLKRNFGFENVLISYFDTHGKFLSWTHLNKSLEDCKQHPYRRFAHMDKLGQIIYGEALRDHLTYFNVEPKLYKSTQYIDPGEYDQSQYVRFIEENFDAHYSVTMAFGINAYIRVSFFKSIHSGDFTDSEMEALNNIYVYVANAYKTYKKYEQAKIVSTIQNEIIASGEKAYLVTDDFMHIMSYNNEAVNYLKDILGGNIDISSDMPCSWLPFLLDGEEDDQAASSVKMRIVRNYTFKIYTYDQSYSNGIIDRYHWITIAHKVNKKETYIRIDNTVLTKAEQRVAQLLYEGLTYKEIASRLTVSYHTIKKHVQNIYLKCGVTNRYELYKWLEEKNK